MMDIFLLVICLVPLCANAQDNFVVGGREVPVPGTYPWQGYITRIDIGDTGFTCGCVLVGPTTVITGARCVQTWEPENYLVTLGAHDKDTEVQGAPVTFTVASRTIHPDWIYDDELGYPNDLATLELSTAIPPDNIYIRPIPLPAEGRTPEDWIGLSCVFTGWGSLQSGSGSENFLHYAEIPVITNEDCEDQWSSELGEGVIQGYHMCSWRAVEQDRGPCTGDGGGPLVCYDASNAAELVGLSSFVISGCGTDFPAVFTRVSYFRSWLDSVIPTNKGNVE